MAAAVYSAAALAAIPAAEPHIAADNGTVTTNLTSAFADQHLFAYSDFSSQNGTFEENSTFKWYSRSLYRPQNRDEVVEL